MAPSTYLPTMGAFPMIEIWFEFYNIPFLWKEKMIVVTRRKFKKIIFEIYLCGLIQLGLQIDFDPKVQAAFCTFFSALAIYILFSHLLKFSSFFSSHFLPLISDSTVPDSRLHRSWNKIVADKICIFSLFPRLYTRIRMQIAI